MRCSCVPVSHRIMTPFSWLAPSSNDAQLSVQCAKCHPANPPPIEQNPPTARRCTWCYGGYESYLRYYMCSFAAKGGLASRTANIHGWPVRPLLATGLCLTTGWDWHRTDCTVSLHVYCKPASPLCRFCLTGPLTCSAPLVLFLLRPLPTSTTRPGNQKLPLSLKAATNAAHLI